MLITVYMAKKADFDSLWAYAQSHIANGLMSWHIDGTGTNGNVIDAHSASDADEDMAWALIMADHQWPGGGYGTAAKTMVANIKSKDINSSNNVQDGDYQSSSSHPDYAAPNYYKVFASPPVGGDTGWYPAGVYTAEYNQLAGAQTSAGLIPDALMGTGTGTFGYDACRAPWRVGLDYCWNGSSQAQTFLTKMVAYFTQASNNGANVSGIKIPVSTGGGTGQFNSGAITGPAAIAAMMSPSNQTFVNNSWTYLYSLVGSAGSPGNLNYFSSTLGLISMLALSGNFIDYTNPPP
jgi:endo-1,4-beta-D-glucanase Y